MKSGKRHQGFSRTDFCAVLSVLAILVATTLSSRARSREPGQRTGCINNLRQLGVALLTYSSENEGRFPPRSGSPYWPARLQPYYGGFSLLRCPNDTPSASPLPPGALAPADAGPRSYIFNGWDDYFQTTLDEVSWIDYLDHLYPFGMLESAIPNPAAT